MSTAPDAEPSSALVGDAYAELAADLRTLAARVKAGPVPAPTRAMPEAVAETVAESETPGAEHTAPWLRLLYVVRDLLVTFVVVPMVTFNVAFRLFPPVR